jgi:hypothetical protein
LDKDDEIEKEGILLETAECQKEGMLLDTNGFHKEGISLDTEGWHFVGRCVRGQSGLLSKSWVRGGLGK